MFNVNGFKAVLIQNNRNESDYYDDQDKNEANIKVCPYNVDLSVKFGIYSTQQAKDTASKYFIVKAKTPVKVGDQLKIGNDTFSIISVEDNWIWNKVANIILGVK